MNILRTIGTIEFDVADFTKKHKAQGAWKASSIIKLDDDVERYYRWFLFRRYGLELNQSLRGSHITFIADRFTDIDKKQYEQVKNHFNGKQIEIVLNLDPRSDGTHWWINIPEEFRGEIHAIREAVGLGRPNFGLHMSIGHANTGRKSEHSKYIHRLLTKKLIP